ncbi:MAG TPA: hypothetical protein VLG71_02100 [Candidatus Limnocylindria bacterium]|nr:hypothetical protein [Candidatus Limnocylindria bacterium]
MKSLSYYLDPQHYTSVVYQLCFVSVTFVLLGIFLYKPFVEFHPVGPRPGVTPVTQETLTAWGKQPAQVAMGLHITDVLRFDIVKNDFIINALIWFAFDEGKVPLKTIDAFSFTKGDIIKKSDAQISTVQGKTVALYSVRVQFTTIIDYIRFPLDDHTLFLNVTNTAASAKDLIYTIEPANFKVSPNMYMSGWQLVGHAVTSGYSSVEVSNNQTLTQPKVVFSLDISKQDIRQLALILFPLIFMFYLGILAFSIRDMAVNITLPIASISSLLAYFFVVQALAPAVGYFMLSDYFFLFFLISSFLTFFVEALGALPDRVLSKLTLERIEGMTILVLHVALVAVMYYLTNIKGL